LEKGVWRKGGLVLLLLPLLFSNAIADVDPFYFADQDFSS